MGEQLGSEITPEEHKYVDMPKNNPNQEGHWRMLGEKGPQIEDSEKIKQPGIIVESVTSGGFHFGKGILIRDDEGRIAQIENTALVADEEKYEWDRDPSVRRPRKMTNPEIEVRYADGAQIKFAAKQKMPPPVYKQSGKQPIQENEDFYDQSHLELRGHDFRLGEFVSFGNGAGKLALIVPGDKPQFGIIAEKVRGGEDRTMHLWMVDADQVDFVFHNEKGAIKRYPDQTLYKPTLGNPEFPENAGH